MFWHVSVHPSVCPHLGGYPDQVQAGGGYPARSSWRGYPCQGGYPTLGTPHQTWLGGIPPRVPPSDLARGVPLPGGTHLRYSPLDLARGVPLLMGTPTGGFPVGGSPARGYPTLGTLTPPWVPPSDLAGGYTCRGVPHLGWSTWYAAVGMPLAFKQEDFLVAT